MLTSGAVLVVKEWGSSVSDDEIFTIRDLEEFHPTNSIEFKVERPKDRQDIDTISLHEIIPQVRFKVTFSTLPSC